MIQGKNGIDGREKKFRRRQGIGGEKKKNCIKRIAAKQENILDMHFNILSI